MSNDTRMGMGQIIVPFEILNSAVFKKNLKQAKWNASEPSCLDNAVLYTHASSDLNDCKYFVRDISENPDVFMDYDIILKLAELRIYRSKLAFLVLSYSYDMEKKEGDNSKAEGSTLENIKKFYDNLHSLTDESPIVKYVKDLLCNSDSSKPILKLCPNTNGKRFYTFNFLHKMSEIQSDGFKAIAGGNVAPNLKGKDIIPYLSQYSLTIDCELRTRSKADEAEIATRVTELKEGLSSIYLISVIKQQSLLKIYCEMNDLLHNRRKAAFMKKELLEYIGKKHYPIVSENEYYDKVYNELLTFLRITTMEQTLKEQLFTINDEVAKKNSSSTSRYLFVIGLFGIVDIIYSGLSIDKMIYDATAGKDSIVFGGITIIAIALCCIGIGFLILVPIYNRIRDMLIKKWGL